MSPSSIKRSFREPLPVLPITRLDNNANYRHFSPSSASTVNEDPPSACEQEHFNVLTSLITPQRLPTNSAALSEKMPQSEKTHVLHTESDVLRAAFVYLLHPVNIAASRLMPNGCVLDCRGEVTESGARTDIKWSVRNDSQVFNIAVLEVKNTRILSLQDFQPAMTNQQNARLRIGDAQAEQYRTLFRRNGIWLSKQANKYARTVGVPHVALFDWVSMFIFDFEGMDEDSANPTLARGIWFQEENKNHNNGETFRGVLLGFLFRALIAKGII